MANSSLGNKLHIDSAGQVSNKRQQVSYIIFTPNTNGDELILKETSSGDVTMIIKGDTAKKSNLHDFSRKPLVFANGIFVDTISSGATALIVTTEAGKS